MAIFRNKKHEHNFTLIQNEIIQDNSLTFGARGLHHYLLSLPKDWKISTTAILKEAIEGRTKLNGYIKELIEQGYIIRHQSKDEKGRFSNWIYDVYEYPQFEEDDPPENTIPKDDLPKADFPNSENETLQSNNIESNNKINKNTNTKITNFKFKTLTKDACVREENQTKNSEQEKQPKSALTKKNIEFEEKSSGCNLSVTSSVTSKKPYQLTRKDFSWIAELNRSHKPEHWSGDAPPLTKRVIAELKGAYETLGCNLGTMENLFKKSLLYVSKTPALWKYDVYWLIHEERFIEYGQRYDREEIKTPTSSLQRKIDESQELSLMIDSALEGYAES